VTAGAATSVAVLYVGRTPSDYFGSAGRRTESDEPASRNLANSARSDFRPT